MELKTASFEKVSTETTTVSGAEAVIKCLLEEGVGTIYGYPGGAIMPIYDELYKYHPAGLHHRAGRLKCIGERCFSGNRYCGYINPHYQMEPSNYQGFRNS